MFCRYLALDDNKVEDFPIGSIIIFPESTIFRIGIIVDYFGNRPIIIYGEYLKDKPTHAPSGITMWITRGIKDVFHAKKDDYDLSQVEYLLSVYNKEKKKNVELIIK